MPLDYTPQPAVSKTGSRGTARTLLRAETVSPSSLNHKDAVKMVRPE